MPNLVYFLRYLLSFSFCVVFLPMPTLTRKQLRRRPSVLYASHAAPSRNLGKEVVAVTVVLGSEIVDVMVTPSSVTRGMKASRSAKKH